MPVLSTDSWDIDYVEVGTGSPVITSNGGH